MGFTEQQKKINLRNVDQKSTLHTPSSDPTGAYYLADNPKYFEPQRANTFSFYVQGLSNKLNIPNNIYAQANADDVIRVAVKTSSIPHFTTNKLTINRGNTQMHFAGKSEFGDGKIALHDYIGAGTKDILLAWQRQVFDPETEKTGLASDYKMDAYLLEYTPDYQLVRTWVLKGCWISGLSESDYDHDSTEVKTIEATIVYDKAYIDNSDIA